MRLEHENIKKLKVQILKIIGSQVDLSSHRVFFFGSRVTGKGDERSDIDVGIEGPKPLPLEALGGIRERLESLPTLYKIDIVDFGGASENFRQLALQKIETIN